MKACLHRWPLVVSSLVGVLLFPSLLLYATPAAAAGSMAVCTYTAHLTATPGWTVLPSKGTGSTNSPAPLSCLGSVEGSPISSKPGSISYQFDYGTTITAALGGDTCALGGGTGQMEITLTTVGGRQLNLRGTFQWFFAAGVPFTGHGTLGDATFDVIGESFPELNHLDQNCVTVPFRYYFDIGQMILQS